MLTMKLVTSSMLSSDLMTLDWWTSTVKPEVGLGEVGTNRTYQSSDLLVTYAGTQRPSLGYSMYTTSFFPSLSEPLNMLMTFFEIR